MVVAKLWGALYALELTWSLGITHLIMEMDSLGVVNLTKHPIDNKYPYSTLSLKIKHLLDRSWAVRVKHIYREANRAANFMASLGHVSAFGIRLFFFLSSEETL